MKKNVLGLAALVLGIVALGLAAIPGIALGQPFPLFGTSSKAPPPPKRDGFTVKYKEISLTFGKDKDKNAAAEQSAKSTKDRLLTWLTIAAVACSLIGLTLGPIAWLREKQPAISGSAIGICCLALIWQYLIVGIVIGVATAAFLIAFSQMSS